MAATITHSTSIAFTCRHLAKRAALLFDRIWVPPVHLQSLNPFTDADEYGDDQPPRDLVVFDESDSEVFCAVAHQNEYRDLSVLQILAGASPVLRAGTEVAKDMLAVRYRDKGLTVLRTGHMDDLFGESFGNQLPHFDICASDYEPSNEYLIDAVAKNLPSVVESKASWLQICEFRKDRHALQDYRRIRLWLTSGIKAQSSAHAADIVAQQIDDYETALRKHGFETSLGILTQLLEPKSLISAATGAGLAAYLDGPVTASLVGSGVMVGQVALWLAKRHFERISLEQYNTTNNVLLLHRIREKFSL